QEEGLPFVVAINKVDKDDADIDRIKTELSEINLIAEDWGGDTICVPISAKNGQGIDKLLEMILLVADMNSDKLTANPNRSAIGTIIESKIDREAGPVATVMVHTGTLRTGDQIVVGNTYGKIKIMKGWKSNYIQSAGPSTPVRFLGFKDAPKVGDILEVVNDDKEFKKKVREFRGTKSSDNIDYQQSGSEGKESALNIILRADVLGSLEAIVQSLDQIKSDDAKIVVAKRGLGDITEADVLQADAIGALVIGFHSHPNQSAVLTAKNKGVKIMEFKIIYELIDFLKENLSKILKTEIIRTELGRLKVIAVFRTEKGGMIVGGKVLDGIIKNNSLAEISRDGVLFDQGKISQLRSGKIEISELGKDQECGVKYEGKPIIEVGDILNIYQEEEKQKTLD
ncbi:MAG: GTP-binding protein, partial [Patescibacteria group bacterium]